MVIHGVSAQGADPKPPLPKVVERLWQEPGPIQDSADAPRLLVVYPRAGGGRIGEEAMRYAGRVEPAAASVSLNGQVLQVNEDGVFAGIRPVAAGANETWRFLAEMDGGVTEVKRTVEREAPAAAVPRRPLAFAAVPVSPIGDYWLPRGGTVGVTLRASDEAMAEYRIGSSGDWFPMAVAGPGDSDGARYVATLNAPAAGRTIEPRVVEFRLRADGAKNAILRSALRVGRIPDGYTPRGRVKETFGTYMKTETTFARWGNWIQRTPFPVLEARGGRVRTGFGHGPEGWLETVQIAVEWGRAFGALPRLGVPVVDTREDRVRLTWPTRKVPVATVIDHQLADYGDRLSVSLPGAARIRKPDEVAAVGALRRLSFLDAERGEAPGFDLHLAGPLWGYEVRCDPAFSMEFRLPPAMARATRKAPLKGLRVAIDAGHGGSDSGALGASGLVESDVNRVQAAWLEHHLVRMGAVVLQVRPGDEEMGLDERIEAARVWEADLFVSLHFNSVAFSADPEGRSGPIVFYHYRASEALARSVARRLAAWWGEGTPVRVEAQNFRVNRNIHFAPSILVETAFLCHPGDESRIRRAGELEESARILAEGIRDHMENLALARKSR